jgi:hypothetical protein
MHATHGMSGEIMTASIAPVERPDPITSNLRGFLLLFFILQCLSVPYYLYGIFDQVRIMPDVLEPSPYAVAYHRFELLFTVAIVIAIMIGLFLVLVRDPRTVSWWRALLAISLVSSVAHIWLERGLPHEHFRPIPEILLRHGALGATIWLAYWTFSARVKVAFGPHYAQPPVSYAVLGAMTAVAVLLVILVIGAATLG